jgi:hypothetical protein
MNKFLLYVFLGVLFSGCASKVLKYDKDKTEKLKDINEFDQVVKIEEIAAPLPQNPSQAPSQDPTAESNKKTAKNKQDKKVKKSVELTKRQPELESDIGFMGRRPNKDPFRVGEKVVHSVRYFKVNAGKLTMEVKPFVQVNGRPSYSFNYHIETSSFYSTFYSVDDRAVTLMDFESMVPNVFTLHVRETGQIRESRAYFDRQKGMAQYWERKVTEKDGEEEKKYHWDIPDYSQNVFSSAFYMRVFQWKVGEEHSFRVADSGENLIFRAKAIRAEKISVEAGDFNAIVIKPEIELKGKFKPVGDIYIWLSDDDRKYILKIESKIKIGTLVSEAISIEPGQP